MFFFTKYFTIDKKVKPHVKCQQVEKFSTKKGTHMNKPNKVGLIPLERQAGQFSL